jgi:hypothetical protein
VTEHAVEAIERPQEAGSAEVVARPPQSAISPHEGSGAASVYISPTAAPPTPAELSMIVQVVESVYTTEFVPTGLRGKQGSVLAAILSGRELGLGWMQSLSSIHVIEGKPTLDATMMRALVQRHGHRFDIDEEWNGDKAVAAHVFLRRREWGPGAEERQVSFTMAEATAAGLTRKGNWAKYPMAMLVARATTKAARGYFADCLAGIAYAPEELGAEVQIDPSSGIQTVLAEPAPAPIADEPLPALPTNDAAPSEGRASRAHARVRNGGEPEAPPEPDAPHVGQATEDGEIRPGTLKALQITLREKGVRDPSDDMDEINYRFALRAAYGVSSSKELTDHQARSLLHVLTHGHSDGRTAEQCAQDFVRAGLRRREEQRDDDADLHDAVRAIHEATEDADDAPAEDAETDPDLDVPHDAGQARFEGADFASEHDGEIRATAKAAEDALISAYPNMAVASVLKWVTTGQAESMDARMLDEPSRALLVASLEAELVAEGERDRPRRTLAARIMSYGINVDEMAADAKAARAQA